MAEVTKVAETSSEGLEPVNFKLISQYDQLRALLAARLSPEHAFLLAEPVPLGGSKGSGRDTAWYVAGAGDVHALHTLAAEDVSTVEQRVMAQLADITRLADQLVADGGAARELGRLLQDALVFPDAVQIFLVGGRPVLVNWGYRKQAGALGANASGGGLLSGARQKVAPPPRPPAPAAPAPAAVAPVAAMATKSARRFGGRWWAAVALWVIFLVLLALIALRLLDACALGPSRWPAFIRNLVPGECSASNAELQSINDAARALEAAIHQKELALATRLAECKAVCAPPPRPTSPPTPTPPPVNGSLTPNQIDGALPPDARRGKIEVTLAWQGPADLDLRIVCPDGKEIGRGVLNNCGGEMVTDDLNKGGGQGDEGSTWVEHVIWNATPVPNGDYQVRAVLYARSREQNPVVRATLILRVNGAVVKTATPSFTTEYKSLPLRPSDTIFTFKVPADTAGSTPNAR